MTTLAVHGSEEDLALAGLSGRFAWGEVRSGPADVLVTLRDAPPPADGAGVWVRLGAGEAAEHERNPDRLIAPVEEGVWRCAPWPVADAVFDLEPAGGAAGALVVGAPEWREEVIGRLEGFGGRASAAERLTVGAMSEAAVCVLAHSHGNLPAEAMAVLAARRVLVAEASELTFGLEPGIEFLSADSPTEAASFAHIALTRFDELRSLRVFARIAAERHRASTLYARVVTDLRLEGALTAPPRSAEPSG